jgi:hypothetical protein
VVDTVNQNNVHLVKEYRLAKDMSNLSRAIDGHFKLDSSDSEPFVVKSRATSIGFWTRTLRTTGFYSKPVPFRLPAPQDDQVKLGCERIAARVPCCQDAW